MGFNSGFKGLSCPQRRIPYSRVRYPCFLDPVNEDSKIGQTCGNHLTQGYGVIPRKTLIFTRYIYKGCGKRCVVLCWNVNLLHLVLESLEGLCGKVDKNEILKCVRIFFFSECRV